MLAIVQAESGCSMPILTSILLVPLNFSRHLVANAIFTPPLYASLNFNIFFDPLLSVYCSQKYNYKLILLI